jgi:hypothetical protein
MTTPRSHVKGTEQLRATAKAILGTSSRWKGEAARQASSQIASTYRAFADMPGLNTRRLGDMPIHEDLTLSGSRLDQETQQMISSVLRFCDNPRDFIAPDRLGEAEAAMPTIVGQFLDLADNLGIAVPEEATTPIAVLTAPAGKHHYRPQ